MMPICHYRKCGKTAEVELGRIREDSDGELWEEVFYLCEKHTKKIEKQLITEIYRR